MKGVIELIDSVEDHTNLIIAPGCDMPYDTPIENTIACAQAVKNPDSNRKPVSYTHLCTLYNVSIESIVFTF